MLLVGFLLWLAYGVAAGNLALIVPNTISTIACLANIAVSLRDR